MKILIIGFFDIIHSGHIQVFNLLKMFGDELIVGVGCDNRLVYKKGNSRPVLSQFERSFIVSNIKSVNKVLCLQTNHDMTTDEHEELYISKVKPDIFVKNEYNKKIDSICKKYNVKLLVVPEITGIDKKHSLDFIKKIKKGIK